MDEITFPVLAGAALVEGVRFAYNQLGNLLERRRLWKQGEHVPPPQKLDLPPIVTADGDLRFNEAAVEEHTQEIELVHTLLGIAESHGSLDAQEPQLRILLHKTKELLEAVYGLNLRFDDGSSTATATVKNRIDEIGGEGQATGAEIHDVRLGGHADVDNEVHKIHDSGQFTGVKIDRIG